MKGRSTPASPFAAIGEVPITNLIGAWLFAVRLFFMQAEIPEFNKFPEFKAHLLCRNSHLQTILSIYIPTRYKPARGEIRKIQTQDQDAIVIHENTPDGWENGNRIVILVHGLCGSHSSQYMMRVSAKLIDCGFKTIRIDMRGFGESLAVSRGHTHAGRSDDLESVLNDARGRYSGSPITIVGFSLGANVTLKLLGEYSDDPPSELDSAVVVSPPIDLLRCTLNLQQGLNRFYDRYFARLLATAVKMRRKNGAPFDDVPIEKFPKQLYEFDDQYTAPAAGFVDADDYYAKCSTQHLLNKISVPTLMLVAEDDPIVPFAMYDCVDSRQITKLISPGGGHLGFISRKTKDPDKRWMDWRIIEWVVGIEQA